MATLPSAFTNTFTEGGLTITVHGETGRDIIAKRLIYQRVLNTDSDDLQVEEAVAFASIITQTDKVEGDLGFVLPGPSATEGELRAAMPQVLALRGQLFRRWLDEIEAASAPPNRDKETLPPAKVNPLPSATPAS